MTVSFSTPSFSLEQLGHVVTGLVQRWRHDVVRPLMGELHDVLAQVGLHCLQVMLFQLFVEIQFLGGHGFRFHHQACLPLLGQLHHEFRDVVGVAAENHFSAVCRDVRFELLQIEIEIIERLLLESVGLCAQFLIVRQHAALDGLRALVHEPAGGGIDGQLQLGIGECLVDFFFESLHAGLTVLHL